MSPGPGRNAFLTAFHAICEDTAPNCSSAMLTFPGIFIRPFNTNPWFLGVSLLLRNFCYSSPSVSEKSEGRGEVRAFNVFMSQFLQHFAFWDCSPPVTNSSLLLLTKPHLFPSSPLSILPLSQTPALQSASKSGKPSLLSFRKHN